MSLMNLVRSIGALAVAWTLVAIGIGASGARLPGPETAKILVRESPPVDAISTSWPTDNGLELIDRKSGRRSPIRPPLGYRWSLIAVSPWHAPGGELEAVGRWIDPTEQDFCGWGLFRLSDGALVGRMATDVLPTGRPCWVPGDERIILFPAGDGRLYRCRLDHRDDEPVVRRETNSASGRAEPSEPIVWATPPPGPGDVFLDAPVWPDAPRLRKWVFVTLRKQERRRGRLAFGPARIWWLEMSEDAGTIVAAGPLTATPEGDAPTVEVEHRFPNVAVGPAGDIRLVYLERRGRDTAWQLRGPDRTRSGDGTTGRRRRRCPGFGRGRGAPVRPVLGLARRGYRVRRVAIGRTRRLARDRADRRSK